MTDQKKYEFTGETKTDAFGRTVKQIRALVDIAAFGVNVGDIGGWIASEKNLSHSGNAWVYGDACVSGDAWSTFTGGTYNRIGSTQYVNGSIVVKLGCFEGSPKQASEAIIAKYGEKSFYEMKMKLSVRETKTLWKAQGSKPMDRDGAEAPR